MSRPRASYNSATQRSILIRASAKLKEMALALDKLLPAARKGITEGRKDGLSIKERDEIEREMKELTIIAAALDTQFNLDSLVEKSTTELTQLEKAMRGINFSQSKGT